MGLFDLPSPVFDYVDGALLGTLAPALRIVIWAALGALLSMELYRVLSPQAKAKALKLELREAQQKVASFDGEFEDAWPLIKRMLGLAFKRIFLIFPSTLIASLPLLFLVVWLDSSYGHRFPEFGEPASVEAPAPFEGKWIDRGEDGTPRAQVLDKGKVVVDTPLKAAIPVVHKWHWWNLLLGNRAGYLTGDAPIEQISIGLPQRDIFTTGPDWVRGWAPAFFLAVLLFAMTLKWIRRIE
ncbi:hypothetical protein V6C03_10400 [Methyloligella sp. 2.7D]|uniref:hypothetical protein n=1 Tax=unclassified Methyloligella TaxID=2625955 RepID=UPI00157CDBBF|nr:hypothetical protein [Methyloligella sp. GL2]QKP77756.1 hypothetical protein HT051_10055 [Methyloligella sp. GL2]